VGRFFDEDEDDEGASVRCVASFEAEMAAAVPYRIL
jgi:hypothetical protein